MNRMKKFLMTGLVMVAALTFSGCVRVNSHFTPNSDKSTTVYSKVCYDKEKTDAFNEGDSKDFSELPVEQINGRDYYVEEKTVKETASKMKKEYPSILVSRDRFYYNTNASGSESLSSNSDIVEYCRMDVTLAGSVEKTNGTIAADGKTVYWDLTNDKDKVWYAYCKGSKHSLSSDAIALAKQLKDIEFQNKVKTDKTTPVVKVVKSGKSRKIYIKDNVKLKSVSINGKSKKLGSVLKNGKYKGYYYFKVTKKGKYKVVATDYAKNKKTVTFTVK